MGRGPCCSKEGLNKGAWTAMEDKILTEYIKNHGEGKWRHLPKRAGLKRCGKSCRLRWLNYLRPGIKRGNITSDEEELIIRLHNLLGNRWSLIAGRLPGRTDNEIKNYWNTNIGRKLQNGSNIITASGAARSSSNKGTAASCVVHTKATRCPNVTLAKEAAKLQGQSNDTEVVVSGNDNDNINGPLDFMADFQMDGNLFSELLRIEFPETASCLEDKALGGNGDVPCNVVERGQLFSRSCNDDSVRLVPWGDSLSDADFDFQGMATFMEPGCDWV